MPLPLTVRSSPSSLCGAVSLLAFLSEARLCSGWQSWVSEIEDLVRKSGGESDGGACNLWSMDGSAGRDEGVSICMRVCRRATLRVTTALRCQHPKYPCHCRIDSRWQNDKCFCKTIWEVRMCLFFPSGDKIEDRELCLAALNMSTNTSTKWRKSD